MTQGNAFRLAEKLALAVAGTSELKVTLYQDSGENVGEFFIALYKKLCELEIDSGQEPG